MKQNLESKARQVLDARGAGRFAGTDPEPRPECRSGPHSRQPEPTLHTTLQWRARRVRRCRYVERERFSAAGIDLSKPVTTTCGSGVTACILALGLHLLGHDDVAVYGRVLD